MRVISSAAIRFEPSDTSIPGPVTKFHGEPHWLEKPQWPLSRSAGTPMEFIGQIALADVPSLPATLRSSGRMAYLFITDPEEEASTWAAEDGENAVIIQPEGDPTIVPVNGQATNGTDGCPEFGVRLTLREEPEFTDPESGLSGVTGSDIYSEEENATWELLRPDKLGGVPCFIQYVEYPESIGPWLPLLQLHDYNEHFSPANFGSGTAWVFISADGRRGRLLWQC